VGGIALLSLGVVMAASRDNPPVILLRGGLIGAALVAGVLFALVPMWLRTTKDLSQAQAQRVRESERADIAAHLHDSVLQALTLIRASAEDPARVRAIALTEERELRAWLYTGHAQAADSLEAAVTEAVVGVESRYGVPISVVVVGDMRPGPREPALIALLLLIVMALLQVNRYRELQANGQKVTLAIHSVERIAKELNVPAEEVYLNATEFSGNPIIFAKDKYYRVLYVNDTTCNLEPMEFIGTEPEFIRE